MKIKKFIEIIIIQSKQNTIRVKQITNSTYMFFEINTVRKNTRFD